jgi:DNA helicase IV
MADKKRDEVRRLEEARPSPYFGRVDFVDRGTPDKTETYYLE